jgi:flagellar export protein FliJ
MPMNLPVIRAYRAQVEEALKVELAELRRAVESEQEAQRRLLTEVESTTAEFLQMAKAGMTVEAARIEQAKLDALAGAVRRAHEAIAATQQRCDQKLAEVLEASRERKKLEILEEREAFRDRRRQQRHEQAALDQSGTVRFLTKEGP